MPDRPHELPSKTHFLLIHCRDGIEDMIPNLREAMAHWQPVWIVLEGAGLALEKKLKAMAHEESSLRVLAPKSVHSKAAAVLHAVELAAKKQFTHVLIMESDGSHPAVRIRNFMTQSFRHPDAMILGRPVPMAGQPSAAARRLHQLPSLLLTCGAGIGEPSFGFNLFPLSALKRTLSRHPSVARGRFDAEMKIRCLWAGVPFVQVPCPVRPHSHPATAQRSSNPWQSVKMFLRLVFPFPGQLLRVRHWGRRIPGSSSDSP